MFSYRHPEGPAPEPLEAYLITSKRTEIFSVNELTGPDIPGLSCNPSLRDGCFVESLINRWS